MIPFQIKRKMNKRKGGYGNEGSAWWAQAWFE